MDPRIKTTDDFKAVYAKISEFQTNYKQQLDALINEVTSELKKAGDDDAVPYGYGQRYNMLDVTTGLKRKMERTAMNANTKKSSRIVKKAKRTVTSTDNLRYLRWCLETVLYPKVFGISIIKNEKNGYRFSGIRYAHSFSQPDRIDKYVTVDAIDGELATDRNARLVVALLERLDAEQNERSLLVAVRQSDDGLLYAVAQTGNR